MTRLALRSLLLLGLVLVPLAVPRFAAAAVPGPDPSLWSTLGLPSRAARPAAVVRARGDRFEIVRDGKATLVFFRGVNLGAAPPGHFPGEFAIGIEDYRRWIRFARELHANAIRVYALHPPAFYRALREENLANPDRPLWLFQEVWTELPETNDFWNPPYRRVFEREIRMTVDAVHGNALVKDRPGHASGRYDADVSPWLAGWLLGREWEPYAVRRTERFNPDTTTYRGEILAVERGTAMECWLGRVCDVAARYEKRNYGLARAVSFVNWPTLDPMRHPTETERGGGEAEHDEDAYSVDPTRIVPRAPVDAASGFLGYFANYHAYPYYPDFLNLDPGYAAFRDEHGACSYAGYLRDLKAHTAGIPLLIGEFGVPTSRGIAHLQPQGIHHGGNSEVEQGMNDVRLLEDIVDAKASGALLFSMFDEWFKVNWMAQKVEAPRDRDPLWHNLLDPEECYGLIAFDPPRCGWEGVTPYAVASDSLPAAGRRSLLHAIYATTDPERLYLRIDLDPAAPARGLRSIGVAFDVLDPDRGDKRLPPPLDATWSRGAERVLLIEPALDSKDDRKRRAAIFVDDRTRYSEFARLRPEAPGGEWQFLKAPYRPVANDDGRWNPMLVETNRERVARDGTLYPARYLNQGRLQYGKPFESGDVGGDTGPCEGVRWNMTHQEWALTRDRRSIEIAIPWGLLGVGDPSSRAVVDDRDGTPEIETTRTPGIALLAWATTAPGARADSLGPTAEGASRIVARDVSFLGPPGTTQTISGHTIIVTSRESRVVVWNGWETPITTERVKGSARFVRKAFEGMESRETKENESLGSRP